MIIHIDKILPPQPPEKEEGNKEYKRYLKCKKTSEKEFIDKRASQMLIDAKEETQYICEWENLLFG